MSDLLQTFAQLSKVSGSYFQRDLSEICMIADLIEEVENLTLQQRYTFCMLPINLGLKPNSEAGKKKAVL